MTRVIGITGGIASGKSTVSNYLRSHHYEVVDCDLLTREAYVDCFENIQESFSDCIENGEINRQKLGAVVFQNSQKRKELEAIIHPYCRQRMTNAIKNKQGGLLFLDIPLLFEAKMDDLCDEIWLVYVDYKTQLERLCARNQYSEQEAKVRIGAQISLEKKRAWADFVLENNSSQESLLAQVKQRLEGYDE